MKYTHVLDVRLNPYNHDDYNLIEDMIREIIDGEDESSGFGVGFRDFQIRINSESVLTNFQILTEITKLLVITGDDETDDSVSIYNHRANLDPSDSDYLEESEDDYLLLS